MSKMMQAFFGIYIRRLYKDLKAYEHIVIFKLDKQDYALDIGNVREISRIGVITRLPGASDFIDGMVDLRGN
jgi:Chemotaxis signal transduction protein